MSPRVEGHWPRMRSGGSGVKALPNSFGWELILFIKTHFYGGGLTSHFMEEHSSLYFLFSLWRHRMDIFCVTGALCREFTGHRGIPLTKPVTRSLNIFFDLRLNKQLSKQSRRRQLETPLRSIWRHCNGVPNSDQVIQAAVGSCNIQRVTLVQFWIGETGQIERFHALQKEWPQSWHTALPWLPFLETDYILHSATV